MLSNGHVRFIYVVINDNTVKPPWDQTEIKLDLSQSLSPFNILKHDLNGPFGLITLVHVAVGNSLQYFKDKTYKIKGYCPSGHE